MKRSFQAVVVGAGPAGSAAAFTMAKAGLDVALLERGNFPGEKNMFGGILHRMPALDDVLTGYWSRAPIERHVVKKGLTFMTGKDAFTVHYESRAFDQTPYNGYTVFRPRFDRWLAEEARKAGATLLTRSTVDDVVLKSGKVAGVTLLHDRGEIRASVVIAADGALSFTALKAGLRRPKFDAAQMAVGVKALFDLPRAMIEDRFGLARDQGFSNEFVGCTAGVRGGGFLYTNLDSVSVGLVLHLGSLRTSGKTPCGLLNDFLDMPHISKLLKGGRLLEYSAHIIPEGGYEMIPEIVGDGILVAGDAAGFCNATGLNLEGINLATHSGMLSGRAVVEACKAGDFSRRGLSVYRQMLEESYVMKDLRLYRRAPKMLHNDAIYQAYPEILCRFMEDIYRIDGTPKKNLHHLFLRTAREKVGYGKLLADALAAWRAL